MTPSGTFSWVKEDGEIPQDSTQEDNKLTINSVGEDDFGVYICTATNDNNSQPLYRNSFSINLKQQGAPGQVTDLTVEAHTSVSVTLGWTCGHNGGDDNMWFEIHISVSGGEYELYDENIPADCSIGERNKPDYRVDGLASETQYGFNVTARNNFPGREEPEGVPSVQHMTVGQSTIILPRCGNGMLTIVNIINIQVCWTKLLVSDANTKQPLVFGITHGTIIHFVYVLVVGYLCIHIWYDIICNVYLHVCT